jgi:hypothetical protein
MQFRHFDIFSIYREDIRREIMSFFPDVQPPLFPPKNNPPQGPERNNNAGASNPFAPVAKAAPLSLKDGNVPLVREDNSKERLKGLGVETTTISSTETTSADKQTEKPFVKTGESVDERLTRYYSKYTNAAPEEKEAFLKRYITGHFSTLTDETKAEQIKIQITDFKKLLSNTKNPDSYEMLAKQISILEKENQVSGAQSAIGDARTHNLKRRAEIGVAKAVHECHEDNQRALTDIIVKSDNKEAQRWGASFASKIKPKNQDYVHGAYFDLNNQDIQKVLTQQLGQYDKDVQQSIYKRTMTSEYQDVLELAAKNIYTLHKDNQVAATKMTIATGNEGAINAAASNANLYNEDVRSEIKNVLSSSGYESVQQTLTQAQKSETATPPGNVGTSSSNVDKVQSILASNSPNKEILLKETIKNLPEAQKLQLISSLSPSELGGILGIILANNPSSEVISKAMEIIAGFNDKDKKQYMQQLKNSSSYQLIKGQIYSLDPSIQKIIIISGENLDNIDRNKLSTPVKEFYDKYLKEQKTKTV